MEPSTLVILILVRMRGKSNNEIPIIQRKSNVINASETIMGLIIAVNPMIERILMMLLPRIFPSARSVRFE